MLTLMWHVFLYSIFLLTTKYFSTLKFVFKLLQVLQLQLFIDSWIGYSVSLCWFLALQRIYWVLHIFSKWWPAELSDFYQCKANEKLNFNKIWFCAFSCICEVEIKISNIQFLHIIYLSKYQQGTISSNIGIGLVSGLALTRKVEKLDEGWDLNLEGLWKRWKTLCFP